MTYYIGNEVNAADLLGGQPRYFYALRRTEDGTLYFDRIDNLLGKDSVTINQTGDPAGDFPFFEWGQDYIDGRDEIDHTRPYENLTYDQYRWDNKSVYYYINADGQLVARINQEYGNYQTL